MTTNFNSDKLTSATIFYMKESNFCKFIGGYGEIPTVEKIETTHAQVGKIVTIKNNISGLESVFHNYQGPEWLPSNDDEIKRAYMAEKGIGHASMSIGDIIRVMNSHTLSYDFYVVARMGFDLIGSKAYASVTD